MKRIFGGRSLAIILGVLWLIDGLAQLQPKMFTKQFANNVVAPAAAGQPHYLYALVHFFIRVFLVNPALFNSLIAATQLGLGLLILYKRTSLFGLKLSVFWSLFVWVVGEALAGLLVFNANLVMGFPGAAIIYGVLAVAAIRQVKRSKESYSGYFLSLFWAVIWFIGGIYQLLPRQNSLSSFISSFSPFKGQPGWMYGLNYHVSNELSGLLGSNQHAMSMAMSGSSSGGYWLILVLAIAEIAIGISVFLPQKISNKFIWLGILLSLAFWLVGQNLGQYYSGLATDLNTGPLLIILGLVILSFKNRDQYIKRVRMRIEKAIL